MSKTKKFIAAALCLASLLVGSTAYSEEKKEEIPKRESREEEIIRVPFAAPTGLNYQNLEQILSSLENSFAEGYQKMEQNGEEKKAVHNRGRVHLRVEKNLLGQEIPVIYLTEKNQIFERLFFSQIENLSTWTVPAANTHHLLITYALPVTNGEGLHGKKFEYYDLLVKDNPELIGGYFSELNEHYSTSEPAPPELNPLGSEAAIKKILEKTLVYPPISLLSVQFDEICQGVFSGLPEDYELKFLGQVNFEDCIHQPEKSYSGLEETAANTNSFLEQDPARGILFLCGNASELSARKCSLPPEEGNFLLSVFRAKETAIYLSEKIRAIKEITVIPYGMGVQLNEKSARVYYVTFKKEKEKMEKNENN